MTASTTAVQSPSGRTGQPAPSAALSPSDRGLGRAALLLCHCAGMVDLIAMPVWMEVLISRYALGPQRAGALVSVFLLAAVVSSVLLASRFSRGRSKTFAVAGFAIAAAVFAASALTTDFALLCALYVAGGAAVGCGLSMTHGTMGRSADPHRLFGLAGAAAGVFSIAFYAGVAALVGRFGGPALFWLLAAVMAVAAAVAALAFPTAKAPAAVPSGVANAIRETRLPRAVWLAIFGVVAMALTQAIATSFLQNIGLAREFGAERVQAVLIGLGLLALFPGPLALWLRGRISTRAVLVAGPLLQLVIVLVITRSTAFWPYAVAGALSTSVQIFMHTFAFGFIATTDTSGRAAAATPAMLMTGSAIGPFLAGSLVAHDGYAALGPAVAVISVVAATCYLIATTARPAPAPALPKGARSSRS